MREEKKEGNERVSMEDFKKYGGLDELPRLDNKGRISPTSKKVERTNVRDIFPSPADKTKEQENS